MKKEELTSTALQYVAQRAKESNKTIEEYLLGTKGRYCIQILDDMPGRVINKTKGDIYCDKDGRILIHYSFDDAQKTLYQLKDCSITAITISEEDVINIFNDADKEPQTIGNFEIRQVSANRIAIRSLWGGTISIIPVVSNVVEIVRR